jgi:acetyl-CoA carboxylase carboxyl transferase subunit alpha
MSEERNISFTETLNKAWSVVEKSRHPQRPHSIDYISALFSDFEEFKGDRNYAEDEAIIAGVGCLKEKGRFPSENVVFIAQEKGRTSKEKQKRNFGLAKPEGYRKACRVLELAERFKKPVITLIDTVGAYPGVEAEERGQSEAIARCLREMALVNVPTIGVVIGEGGSGGALAIGVVDRLLMLENATYSVISPESCAAILWGNSAESKQAAHALRLGARDVFSLGLCDEVIEEPDAGAHENFEATANNLHLSLLKNLSDLKKISPSERIPLRFEKYRGIDKRRDA